MIELTRQVPVAQHVAPPRRRPRRGHPSRQRDAPRRPCAATCASARHLAARRRWCSRPRPPRCSTAAPTCPSTTSGPWPRRRCATAWCSATRRRPTVSAPTSWSPGARLGTPVRARPVPAGRRWRSPVIGAGPRGCPPAADGDDRAEGPGAARRGRPAARGAARTGAAGPARTAPARHPATASPAASAASTDRCATARRSTSPTTASTTPATTSGASTTTSTPASTCCCSSCSRPRTTSPSGCWSTRRRRWRRAASSVRRRGSPPRSGSCR